MKQEKILSIILLAFSIEYLGYGELSIFRVIILPLSLLGLIIKKDKTNLAIFKRNLFVVLLMSYFALCSAITNANVLFAIFNLPFMLYIGKSISSNLFARIDVARIFSLYSVPHIFAFIFLKQLAFLEEGRFNGLHEDSNFCGIYLLLAFAASTLLLLYRKQTDKWMIYDITNSVICSYLIVISGSRGALLTYLLFLSFLIYKSRLSKSLKYTIAAFVFIGYFSLMAYIESLPIYVSTNDGYIDFVLSRFKKENMEGGSNRILFWTWAFDAMKREALIVPIGTNFMGTVFYTHNTYIDLLLELGLFQGLILVILFFINIVKTLLYILKPIPLQLLVMDVSVIIVSITLFLLSADRQKIFWMIVCFLIYRPIIKSYNYE